VPCPICEVPSVEYGKPPNGARNDLPSRLESPYKPFEIQLGKQVPAAHALLSGRAVVGNHVGMKEKLDLWIRAATGVPRS
jgi:hypothetical protein